MGNNEELSTVFDPKVFGHRLERARNARKDENGKPLTQTALARKMSTTQSQISKYENGTQVPSIETLIELARNLGVSLDELCGLEKPEQKTTPFQWLSYLSELLASPPRWYTVMNNVEVDGGAAIYLADQNSNDDVDSVSEYHVCFRGPTLGWFFNALEQAKRLKGSIDPEIWVDLNKNILEKGEKYFVPGADLKEHLFFPYWE